MVDEAARSNAPLSAPSHAHDVVREGVLAGLLGATSVAAWFFIVDLVAGRPLHTPLTLGRALISVLGPAAMPDGALTVTLAYTVAHYAVFIAIGLMATWLVHRSESVPSVLAGFLILFLAFQLAFFGLVAILTQSPQFGEMAWYQIGLANLVAFGLMGTYIYRRHPAVGARFGSVLAGGE